MDLVSLNEFVKREFSNSNIFPYDTGTLKRVFFDNEYIIVDNRLVQPILNSKELIVGKSNVNYGKLLEIAPSIRYAIKRDKQFKGNKYNYIKHANRHFRYIEHIIERDVISAIENEYGVKKI